MWCDTPRGVGVTVVCSVSTARRTGKKKKPECVFFNHYHSPLFPRFRITFCFLLISLYTPISLLSPLWAGNIKDPILFQFESPVCHWVFSELPRSIMATVDGRPAQYGLTLRQLRELMELRGREACEQLNRYGGVREICKKIYTSPTEGKIIL